VPENTSILVVDDEQVVREMLCETIEGLPYEVRSVSSGKEAVAALGKQAAHVVITDIMMPEMDGFALLRYIRENFPGTVVVAITGYGTIEDAVRAIKEGAFDYVTKPFTLDQVRMVVNRAVGHYHLEQDNRRLQAQLRRSEELAFVGRLAAQVAHELNNPLDGALRFVNLTLEQLGPERDAVAEYQREVRAGLLRMAGIVQALLEYSRSSTAMNAPENIHKMLRDAVAQCVIPRGIEVKYDLATEAVVLAGGELTQVFINLIKNACDAMDAAGDGGELTVRTRLDAGNIYIEIEDTGPGIREDLTERIFYPFFTTKSAGKGTGLGLAVSSDIVKRCGGDITVRSKLGQGATFVVQLPARNTPLTAAQDKGEPAERATGTERTRYVERTE